MRRSCPNWISETKTTGQLWVLRLAIAQARKEKALCVRNVRRQLEIDVIEMVMWTKESGRGGAM